MRAFGTHARAWRHPAAVIADWQTAADVPFDLTRHHVDDSFWEALERLGITLLVSRETEHLVMALSSKDVRRKVTYLRLPHPSGIAVDRIADNVAIASTRNPNQVFEFAPATGEDGALVPVASRFYPGALYLHDLAWIDGELYGNAVGQNAVVHLGTRARHPRVWWPRAIEADGDPRFDRNFLQLNSIAAGSSIEASYFTASTATMSSRRPGHRNFPVDRRGVIFSGATREPIVTGLTRPHSARLHDGDLWVDDSGYGTFGVCRGGRMEVVTRLPGWTRGLAIVGSTAFVGTSHVLPRYAMYAPGVDPSRTVCGVHAIDIGTGDAIGSITWPSGNQIFAIDWLTSWSTTGFPFAVAGRRTDRRGLFYSYAVATGPGRTVHTEGGRR